LLFEKKKKKKNWRYLYTNKKKKKNGGCNRCVRKKNSKEKAQQLRKKIQTFISFELYFEKIDFIIMLKNYYFDFGSSCLFFCFVEKMNCFDSVSKKIFKATTKIS